MPCKEIWTWTKCGHFWLFWLNVDQVCPQRSTYSTFSNSDKMSKNTPKTWKQNIYYFIYTNEKGISLFYEGGWLELKMFRWAVIGWDTCRVFLFPNTEFSCSWTQLFSRLRSSVWGELKRLIGRWSDVILRMFAHTQMFVLLYLWGPLLK